MGLPIHILSLLGVLYNDRIGFIAGGSASPYTDCFATMEALQYIFFYPDLKQLNNYVHLILSRLMNPPNLSTLGPYCHSLSIALALDPYLWLVQ